MLVHINSLLLLKFLFHLLYLFLSLNSRLPGVVSVWIIVIFILQLLTLWIVFTLIYHPFLILICELFVVDAWKDIRIASQDGCQIYRLLFGFNILSFLLDQQLVL
jgi:hypothetical protein